MHPSEIPITDYTYELPEDRIAVFPLPNRDASKLLVYNNGQLVETVFHQLPATLPPDSVLVFNNTRVIQARLIFQTPEGHLVEVFCLEPATGSLQEATGSSASGKARWNCLVGNLRRWKEKQLSMEVEGIRLSVELVKRNTSDYDVEFSWQPAELNFFEIMERLGNLPIPPYLNRASTPTDNERYQTVYASRQGSVAAPTAGLHFTQNLLQELATKNIPQVQLTLHVGAGTFKPVKSDTMAGHHMHSENMLLPIKTIEQIKALLDKKIICVGTTSLRALESLYWMGLKISLNPGIALNELEIKQWEVYDYPPDLPGAQHCLAALLSWMHRHNLDTLNCRTSILIAPPYSLKIAKGLITNFHQPQSTLLLLVAAVAGPDWKKIYEYALQHGFRFLSYGDSSLLLK